MTCDIAGGCKVCPVVWIAAAFFLVMLLQSWWSGSTREVQSPASVNASVNASANATEASEAAERTPLQDM